MLQQGIVSHFWDSPLLICFSVRLFPLTSRCRRLRGAEGKGLPRESVGLLIACVAILTRNHLDVCLNIAAVAECFAPLCYLMNCRVPLRILGSPKGCRNGYLDTRHAGAQEGDVYHGRWIERPCLCATTRRCRKVDIPAPFVVCHRGIRMQSELRASQCQ